MSKPLPSDESGPVEAPAVVFARMADVPLDVVDKLIETTRGVYDDLNKVRGHPYWGDLVLHQGAAIRALNEARECLDTLRSTAVGARNTELGIVVATVVIGGERYYAHGEDDKGALVERALRPDEPARARHVYVWDRPYEHDEIPGPYQRIRLLTDPESETGVLNYTEETEDGELRSWHTANPSPLAEAPVLRFDLGSALTFPRDSVIGFDELTPALTEFLHEGTCPTSVRWQQARWGE